MFLLAWDWIYYCVIASISPTISQSSSTDYSHIWQVNVCWKSKLFLGCCWYWRTVSSQIISRGHHQHPKPAVMTSRFHHLLRSFDPGWICGIRQLLKSTRSLNFPARVQLGPASTSQTLSRLKHREWNIDGPTQHSHLPVLHITTRFKSLFPSF